MCIIYVYLASGNLFEVTRKVSNVTLKIINGNPYEDFKLTRAFILLTD